MIVVIPLLLGRSFSSWDGTSQSRWAVCNSLNHPVMVRSSVLGFLVLLTGSGSASIFSSSSKSRSSIVGQISLPKPLIVGLHEVSAMTPESFCFFGVIDNLLEMMRDCQISGESVGDFDPVDQSSNSPQGVWP
jgi:hypothetical protein